MILWNDDYKDIRTMDNYHETYFEPSLNISIAELKYAIKND